jgi:hypothetical protein
VRYATRFVVVGAAVGLVSCSSGGSGGPGGSRDAGGQGAQACNTIVNGSSARMAPRIAQNPPGPLGGTIQSGTYFNSAASVFTGPGGSTTGTGVTRKTTLVIDMTSATNGSVQMVDSLNGAPDVRTTGSLSVSGTSLLITWTCPTGAGTLPAGYTATPSELDLQVKLTDGTTVVDTLTKQ